MAGLAKAIIIGHLGRDPEMRYTPTGKPVTSFSVATSRAYTDASGDRKEETQWFKVQAWNHLAEIASQYLRKGAKVFVEGRISTRSWVGNDETVRFEVQVTASDIQMLDRKPDGEGGPAAAGDAEDGNEVIPF